MNIRHVACELFALILYSHSVRGQSLSASVTVDTNSVIKTIDAGVFGANVEWFHDGNLIWDENTNSNNTTIVNRARDLGVTLLRFPGGTLADYYHWRHGIGPRSLRPVDPDVLDSDSSANNFGLHEFMAFCQAVGAQALIQTNIITGTASEAADWVQYSNAPVQAERAANGSVAPFDIKYWEIGNEQYLPNWWGAPGSSLLSASDYTNRLISWSTAMKAVDPTIKIGAVGGKNFGRYTLLRDDSWNQTVLQNAGKYIDFLALHNGYAPIIPDAQGLSFWDVYGAMLAFPQLVANNLSVVSQQIAQYAPDYADKIAIAITEWGPLFDISPANPYVDHAKTLGSGVFTASMLRTFLLADRVKMANLFELTQPLFLGMINYDGVVKPSYLAMQLYTKYFGTSLVQTAVTSPTYNSVATGLMDAIPNVPYIESISSLSADGKTAYVMIINKHMTSAIQTTVRLRNFTPSATGTLQVMSSGSVDANNGNDLPNIPGVTWAQQATAPVNPMFYSGSPGTVTIHKGSFTASSQVRYTAPPISVSVLIFKK